MLTKQTHLMINTPREHSHSLERRVGQRFLINNLQALRAFAAINVVLFHTLGVANFFGYKTQIFNFLNGWGASGVDFFFVISGFLMVYIQAKNPKSAFSFFKNRFKRIVPTYWTLTVFITILYYFSATKFNLYQSLTSLMFVSQLLGQSHPTILQGWTLEYEMFFYLVFAFAIFIKPQNTPFVTTLILLVPVLFGYIDPIVIEFILGMLIAYLYLRGRFQKHMMPVFAVGLIGLLASMLVQTELHRVMQYGFPATFLVLGCCYLPQIKNRFVLYLGEASYSIYLIQAFTMPAFFMVIKRLNIPHANPDLIILLSLFLTIFAGCCFYHLFERPLGKYLK